MGRYFHHHATSLVAHVLIYYSSCIKRVLIPKGRGPINLLETLKSFFITTTPVRLPCGPTTHLTNYSLGEHSSVFGPVCKLCCVPEQPPACVSVAADPADPCHPGLCPASPGVRDTP